MSPVNILLNLMRFGQNESGEQTNQLASELPDALLLLLLLASEPYIYSDGRPSNFGSRPRSFQNTSLSEAVHLLTQITNSIKYKQASTVLKVVRK
jgi:hypothetical protein